jgi:hypothetical protein
VYNKELTKYIVVAAKKLDRLFVGMKAQIMGACYSADPKVSKAGNELYTLIKSKKNAWKSPYVAKTEDIDTIVEHLYSDYATYSTDAQILDLITPLSMASVNLSDLVKQRGQSIAKKPDPNFSKIRHQIDKVWHQLENLINGYSLVNSSTGIEKFIAEINPIIVHFNEEYHRVKYDISVCNPAPIPKQTYTGVACTPIPLVYYKSSKNVVLPLVLGKDFNLTYKKNVEVGIADCTIHGKGAYNGKRTITFSIERVKSADMVAEMDEKDEKTGRKSAKRRANWAEPMVETVAEIDVVAKPVEEKVAEVDVVTKPVEEKVGAGVEKGAEGAGMG